MLTWATWLLAQHPEAQAKMQKEIDTILQGRDPTFEDMKKLEQVSICEVHPSMLLGSRRSLQP